MILATAALFVEMRIQHPFFMVAFLLLTAATFSLFGFIIGIWAQGFEQLQFIPLWSSRPSPSSAAPSTRSTCSRPSGARSPCSILWST